MASDKNYVKCFRSIIYLQQMDRVQMDFLFVLRKNVKDPTGGLILPHAD
jgi:hypothetical protein